MLSTYSSVLLSFNALIFKVKQCCKNLTFFALAVSSSCFLSIFDHYKQHLVHFD